MCVCACVCVCVCVHARTHDWQGPTGCWVKQCTGVRSRAYRPLRSQAVRSGSPGPKGCLLPGTHQPRRVPLREGAGAQGHRGSVQPRAHLTFACACAAWVPAGSARGCPRGAPGCGAGELVRVRACAVSPPSCALLRDLHRPTLSPNRQRARAPPTPSMVCLQSLPPPCCSPFKPLPPS